MGEWYFEYEIQVNRPGLLGDIASLLGMYFIIPVFITFIFQFYNKKKTRKNNAKKN